MKKIKTYGVALVVAIVAGLEIPALYKLSQGKYIEGNFYGIMGLLVLRLLDMFLTQIKNALVEIETAE